MKLATWNVNSVRARLERVLDWLETRSPDVALPAGDQVRRGRSSPAARSRRSATRSSSSGRRPTTAWRSSRSGPITDVTRNMGDDDEPRAPHRRDRRRDSGGRRLRAQRPGGGLGGLPLQARLVRAACAHLPRRPGERRAAAAAVRRLQRRARSPSTCTTPPRGRARRSSPRRSAPPGSTCGRPTPSSTSTASSTPSRASSPGGTTACSAFPKNLGLRIDHILVDQALAARCTSVEIDREARKGKQPSDHAPVIAEFTA